MLNPIGEFIDKDEQEKAIKYMQTKPVHSITTAKEIIATLFE